MISIDNVSFGYGEAQETLSQVSAAIAPGECVLLCGASGCGKTTVTKLINGLIPAFTPGCRLEGRVEVDGLDPGTTPMYELARKVGSVFQNPKSQFFNLDTDSELAFGLENEGRPPEEIRKRVSDTVDALHLQELQARNIFSLSGGQKQLLAFGSVYAMGPEIFVLDEPTANLDQDAIARLHDQIAGLKRQGRTVVIAEHRLYFLTDLIDRVLYLRDGVLERTFTRKQFCALTDREREALGLRTLIPAGCTLPAAAPAGAKEGLSVEGLTCAYRKEPPVFQALSFSARPGEVVAITGPNGVGKTTLSRCLCGLIREQAGQIVLNGRPLNRKEQQKAAFCVMQDVNHQLFSDSVWGECRMSAPDVPDSSLKGVLDSLHLLPFRERHPMSLSGGQKQRLAVATALLSEKPILIFDEPTSGLDYARMVEVSGVIRSLAQQGRIVLVVTHDQEFLQRACDRVLRL
ncbi:energy-coupling factor ABC transporter ATP-binding protein [Intestinimonas timonensis]|uniref:ABC transporter ATP-binding protein n=1 Tax=Intestinimonas timonensis TaxID=1689270 RepID=UPI0024B0808C|nr:energy-coupling factor ABC transporter ATP-binding protein [Intestinimonas timonensis]